uniref:Uncharacterized protein n=1 Tax=Timema cristinae TaxID=61476 RepID=A0A7R9HGH1_TIMCR|nr:unnamed protein product [Timema cristinae]
MGPREKNEQENGGSYIWKKFLGCTHPQTLRIIKDEVISTQTVLMRCWCPNEPWHSATVAPRSWESTEPQYSMTDSLEPPARVIASGSPRNITITIGDMVKDRRVARGSPFAKISHPVERISQAERHRRCRREQLRIEQEGRVRLRKMQSSLGYPKDAVKIKDIDTRPKRREDLQEIVNRALDQEGYQSVYFRISGSGRKNTGRKDRQTDIADILFQG